VFAKIYLNAWLPTGAAAGVFYVTGNMTMLAIVVFGIVAYGLTFLGMMNVLPSTLTPAAPEPIPAKEKPAEPASAGLLIPRGAQTMRI
jgi:hypothetical protein